ncbi:hypothetical protein ACFWCA_19285 [Streptomyces phaeochromogenes]|uniref:hypothetical protein n=1 Tax=Streptomyces phaeochromogenes TaxID=1923 RepID=UPI0036CB5850
MPQAGIKYGAQIPGPDYDQIAEDAEKAVHKALGVIRTEDLLSRRPEDLVKKTAEIIRQADAQIAVHLTERDEALAHLRYYEPHRRLHRTAGLSPIGFRNAVARAVLGDQKANLPDATSNEGLAQVAQELGVKRLDDARAQLLEAAPIVAGAQNCREIAMRYMQQVILALSEPPYSWSPQEIADHAGMPRDTVYSIRRVARKRRDS